MFVGVNAGRQQAKDRDSAEGIGFMVDRNIVKKLGLSEQQLEQQVGEMFGDEESGFLEEVLQKKVDSRLPGSILKGTIVSQIGNDVIVEVGLKSEGVVDASEFEDPEDREPGKEIEVLLEDTDSEGGLILLSKHKADRIRGWERIINTRKEGDVVSGKVIRRIKGGLLVDIGVPVFLPASQVDIRKPGDISRFIGQEVLCKILKIDIENRNIVVSRRRVVEEDRRLSKEKILAEVEVGQVRKGVVKNIADFGVFVDLGGLDGLLHISDMTWGRIAHPSEIVELDQEIECAVIGFDRENEKISLGLKQKTENPWETVESRYPVGARVRGKVVNVMNYGAFVRLEDGIEGLVHISEMSWTKRLAHPGEMVNLGDEIEVVVLNVNKEKQEISLGIKQTEVNPWTIAPQKYPPGTIVTAAVRSMTYFGAFVEIEEGIDGMIHISDLSWTRKYSHPGEALKKSQEVKCIVLEVDEAKQRMSLGVKQMTEDPWIRAIPEKYIPGHIIKGKVAKITNFGAFVELETDLEGLLHISELADHKIDKPQDIVNVGDEIEVKILKVDSEARKIGLSLRRVQWAAEEGAEDSEQQPEPQGILSGVSIGGGEVTVEPEEKSDEQKEDGAEKTSAPQEEAEESKDADAEVTEAGGQDSEESVAADEIQEQESRKEDKADTEVEAEGREDEKEQSPPEPEKVESEPADESSEPAQAEGEEAAESPAPEKTEGTPAGDSAETEVATSEEAGKGKASEDQADEQDSEEKKDEPDTET